MIEQTDLVVNELMYTPPVAFNDSTDKITSHLSLEVMKKTAPTKKGLACRFTSKFYTGDHTILLYVAEDSYVIDLADSVDANEIYKMISNSYSKFREKYEFRKLGTILQDTPLNILDESKVNVNAIVPLLN